MWTALASLASLVAGIGIGWTAARAGVRECQPEARAYFAAPDMPYAGIVDAEVLSTEDRVRRAH